MTKRTIYAAVLSCATAFASTQVNAGASPAQQPLTSGVDWHRAYKLGDVLVYEMDGNNQGWKYQLRATDTIKQDTEGTLFEQIAWSDLHSNDPRTLSPESLAFRQDLSLDGTGKHLAIPNLSAVQPFLIGPITDALTIYSDLLLAKRNNLTHVGQHLYVKYGKPNSWADGRSVLIGQDSIDFDLTLVNVDNNQHTAELLIHHVPPRQPQIELRAAWMRTQVSDTPNNWVQISRSGEKYVAEVGKETFDVRILVDTRDGKILNAHLDNPVSTIRRECDDAALEKCGPQTPEEIHREVDFRLLP